MVKDSCRRCSHCGRFNGHNSRTCPEKVSSALRLFGVDILENPKEDEDELMRKSKSTGSLITFNSEQYCEAEYHSDSPIHSQLPKLPHQTISKKGVSWTAEEHQSFLEGLDKLGKGDWKGISREYVPSRTPTQIASHAQKYFLRVAGNEGRKRRTSLFDVPFKQSQIYPSGISQQIAAEISARKSSFRNQVAKPLEASKIVAMPEIPEFLCIPKMMAVANNMTIPYVAMNNIPSHGYGYFPPSNGNCAPFGEPSQTETAPTGTSLPELELDGLDLSL